MLIHEENEAAYLGYVNKNEPISKLGLDLKTDMMNRIDKANRANKSKWVKLRAGDAWSRPARLRYSEPPKTLEQINLEKFENYEKEKELPAKAKQKLDYLWKLNILMSRLSCLAKMVTPLLSSAKFQKPCVERLAKKRRKIGETKRVNLSLTTISCNWRWQL